jgi:hypothetical protein
MAAPVVASYSTASNPASSTLVVTNPSGLTAGDEMLLNVSWYDTGSTRTLSTPSGWTARVNTVSDFVGAATFTKTASSGDVSAGNVTLSFSGAPEFNAASFLRITGAALGSEVAGSEVDSEAGPTGTTPSYTTALTPTSGESLVVVAFSGASNSLAGTPSVSSYATTPSVTFTEVADISSKSGADGIILGVAAGSYSGTSQITNRTATYSEEIERERYGTIVVYNAPQSVTGTPSLGTASPTLFTVAGLVGGSAFLGLESFSPTFFSVSGTGSSQQTTWTTVTKS